MKQQRRTRGIDRSYVSPDFVGLEFKALARVCAKWGEPEARKREEFSVWREKLLAFRDGARAGIGSGAQESVPRELVRSEYKTIYVAVQELQRKGRWVNRAPLAEQRYLRGSTVTYGFKNYEFTRPFPIPPNGFGRSKLPGWVSNKLSEVAMLITSRRFGMGYETTRDLAYHKQHRFEYRPLHGLLASVFLDLAASGPANVSMRDDVFEVLLHQRYPAIALHYLVLLAQNLPGPLSETLPSATEIKGLCAREKDPD